MGGNIKSSTDLNQGYLITYLADTRRNDRMSLLRQNDVATSFWHINDVIFASCVRLVAVRRVITKFYEVSKPRD